MGSSIAMVDTHCHLYLEEFSNDISEIIQRAESEGVSKFYLPNIDWKSLESVEQLERRFERKCVAMIGLHPCSVRQDFRQELELMSARLQERPFAAIGEIGLDFYWDLSFQSEQYEAFRTQIQWARQKGIPIVIHSRQSMQETIATVKEGQDGSLRGIFHCFNDSLEAAQEIIDLGFYLGIGGVITYKNSRLPEVVAKIGLEHLVLETDAPYLPPVPFRGKRNESSYIKYTALKLASIFQKEVKEVAEITTENAGKIFGY